MPFGGLDAAVVSAPAGRSASETLELVQRVGALLLVQGWLEVQRLLIRRQRPLDFALTLAQSLPLTGSLIVTTPQAVATLKPSM